MGCFNVLVVIVRYFNYIGDVVDDVFDKDVFGCFEDISNERDRIFKYIF